MVVVEEFPDENTMPSAPARTTTAIRIGMIARGILFFRDI
jgi:hypothetical protein